MKLELSFRDDHAFHTESCFYNSVKGDKCDKVCLYISEHVVKSRFVSLLYHIT